MKLTKLELTSGLIIVECGCCGEIYKSHKMANALTYSSEPNYGCDKCKGVKVKLTAEIPPPL